MLLRQAGRLRAEEKDIAFLVFDIRKPLIRMRGKREDACSRQRIHAGLKILVNLHIGQIVIIQSGAL